MEHLDELSDASDRSGDVRWDTGLRHASRPSVSMHNCLSGKRVLCEQESTSARVSQRAVWYGSGCLATDICFCVHSVVKGILPLASVHASYHPLCTCS